ARERRLQALDQRVERRLRSAVEEDALAATCSVLAIAPHQVRPVDALLPGVTELSHQPRHRRAIGGCHVGVADDPAEVCVLSRGDDGMCVADAHIAALPADRPGMYPSQRAIPI